MKYLISKKLKTYTLLLVLIFITIMQSCNNEEANLIELDFIENSLNLEAPNGEIISQDILSLKLELGKQIAENFEDDVVFNITNIEYLPLNEGFSAIIGYKTDDGFEGNIVKTNNSSFNFTSDLIVRQNVRSSRLRSGVENEGGVTMIISCKKLGSCECRVTAIRKDGKTYYSCGDCDDCEMTIEYK